jgi:hypothetical protein
MPPLRGSILRIKFDPDIAEHLLDFIPRREAPAEYSPGHEAGEFHYAMNRAPKVRHLAIATPNFGIRFYCWLPEDLLSQGFEFSSILFRILTDTFLLF